MANFNLADLLGRTVPAGDCMEWSRARSKAGYGQVWDGTRVAYAHRLVAEIAHGLPRPGLEVLHSCDNPPCINPAHLSWGTRAENMADAKAKGRLKGKRHPSGASHPSTPLTAADVLAMRERREQKATLRELSEAFGVSIAAVHQIVTRKTWREV